MSLIVILCLLLASQSLRARTSPARLCKDLPQLPKIARGLLSGVIRHNAEYFMPGFDPDTKNNYPQAEAALRELGFAIAS